jgi:hypothetical protein
MSYKTGYIQPIYTDELTDGGGGGVYYLPKDPVVFVKDPPPVDFIDPPPPPPDYGGGGIVSLDKTMEAQGVTIWGSIFDNQTKTLLPGCATQTFNLRTGEKYNEPHINQSGTYSLWNGAVPIEEIGFKVSHEGYNTLSIAMSDLQSDPDIYMKKKGSSTLLLTGLAAAALIAFAKKKKKEVGKVTVQDVMPFLLIGGGVLAFSFVKQLLEALGIWKSKDEKELDGEATDPGSFWNPNFWRTKPVNIPFSYAISTATAIEWADELYDAFGPFNDCEECAINVFKRCRTKANASFICDVFQQRYGQDCLTFLRGGWWPQDRLSDADVNVINNYVKNLPNY